MLLTFRSIDFNFSVLAVRVTVFPQLLKPVFLSAQCSYLNETWHSGQFSSTDAETEVRFELAGLNKISTFNLSIYQNRLKMTQIVRFWLLLDGYGSENVRDGRV